MKRILAVAIFVASFCVFANSVRAESNPLLTIFEAIRVGGSNPTELLSAYNALIAFSKQNSFCKNFSERIKVGVVNGTYLPNRYTWTCSENQWDSLSVSPPMATLEIEHFFGLIVSAKYTYKFLDLEKSLNK